MDANCDLPLLRSFRKIARHLAHNARNNESAYRGCDQNRDGDEGIDNQSRKCQAVGSSDAACESASSEKQQKETYYCQAVSDA